METGRISERSGGSPGFSSSLSAKWKIRVIFVGNHIAHRGAQNHPRRLQSRAFSARFSRDLGPSLRTGAEPRKRPRKDRAFRPQPGGAGGMSSSMSLLRPPPPAAATRRGGELDGPAAPKSPPVSSPKPPPPPPRPSSM